jgi:3-hydroxyacyl-CoA dehydrogenase
VQTIESLAVLGAGTMGSRIAAVFAACNVPVLLLDLTEEIAAAGLARAAAGPLVTPASFDRGIPQLEDFDWVLEAVPENLAIKRDLWQRAATYLKPSAIASTNTSGLSIAAIAEGMPLSFTERFLGIHFFNPPAQLRLVELIPGPHTRSEVADRAAAFARERLHKTVVQAKDTPNFIANRIGAFFSATAQNLTVSGNYTVEEVDMFTGTLIGLPRSGTYRLMDVIGLDIWAQVMRTLERTDPRFCPQPFFTKLLDRNFLGEKTGQGFYRKRSTEDQKHLEAINLQTLEYHPAVIYAPASSIPDLPERLRHLLSQDSRASRFLQPLLSDLFQYCHQVAPEIAHSPADIDLAMQHGYGWILGPFALEKALA